MKSLDRQLLSWTLSNSLYVPQKHCSINISLMTTLKSIWLISLVQLMNGKQVNWSSFFNSFQLVIDLFSWIQWTNDCWHIHLLNWFSLQENINEWIVHHSLMIDPFHDLMNCLNGQLIWMVVTNEKQEIEVHSSSI